MKEGKHDFSGDCAPGGAGQFRGQQTFSVGIFKWVAKNSGKGLKKGAVKVRVSGLLSKHDAVYAAASKIAQQLDLGTYTGPKNVKVGAPEHGPNP